MEYDKLNELIALVHMEMRRIKKIFPKELLTINRAINQAELNQL